MSDLLKVARALDMDAGDLAARVEVACLLENLFYDRRVLAAVAHAGVDSIVQVEGSKSVQTDGIPDTLILATVRELATGAEVSEGE